MSQRELEHDRGEERQPSDRRRRPTRFWDAFVTPARRRAFRRAEDELGPRCPIVDRHAPSVRLLVVAVLILTLVDGILTLLIIESPREEANPFMAMALGRSPWLFFVAKYLLTAAGLAVFLVLRYYRLFGTRVRVGHFIPVLAVLYVVLMGYQLHLLSQRRALVAVRTLERSASATGEQPVLDREG
jgi:hypothetical protein